MFDSTSELMLGIVLRIIFEIDFRSICVIVSNIVFESTCCNHVSRTYLKSFRHYFLTLVLIRLGIIVELSEMTLYFRQPISRWGNQAAKDFLYPVIIRAPLQKHLSMTPKSTESQHLCKSVFGDTSCTKCSILESQTSRSKPRNNKREERPAKAHNKNTHVRCKRRNELTKCGLEIDPTSTEM